MRARRPSSQWMEGPRILSRRTVEWLVRCTQARNGWEQDMLFPHCSTVLIEGTDGSFDGITTIRCYSCALDDLTLPQRLL
jgi:hypothetical protein